MRFATARSSGWSAQINTDKHFTAFRPDGESLNWPEGRVRKGKRNQMNGALTIRRRHDQKTWEIVVNADVPIAKQHELFRPYASLRTDKDFAEYKIIELNGGTQRQVNLLHPAIGDGKCLPPPKPVEKKPEVIQPKAAAEKTTVKQAVKKAN
jgi:hypothetical protein